MCVPSMSSRRLERDFRTCHAGGDDEPLRYVTEVSEWITKPDGDWRDVDGFDFRAAADAMPRYVSAL